jgi:hypothetical protein
MYLKIIKPSLFVLISIGASLEKINLFKYGIEGIYLRNAKLVQNCRI